MAQESGLDLVGAAPAGPTHTWSTYQKWIHDGYAADMSYLARPDAMQKRQDPRHILPAAKTVLVTAVSYGKGAIPNPQLFHGIVSRYAWGEDYHRWLLARCRTLVRKIEQASISPVISRCYVDTGPVLERAWAQSAGLGWIGKNTCLINPSLGSYIFLGVIFINLELELPRLEKMPDCGSCEKCMQACPTGALVEPGILDANRCLSYLTIENRGSIPQEYRKAVGNRVFGCDVCQEVCPWNKKVIVQARPSAEQDVTLDLRKILEMDAEGFRKQFRSSAIWRATPEGLARNAAVVFGNQMDRSIAAYINEIADIHSSELVRQHLRWAQHQPYE
jgi:epoxyqueuosine reductase